MKKENENELVAALKVLSAEDNGDGTAKIEFELTQEFVDWFKKKEGLKRFSHKKFSKVINEAIKNAATDGTEGLIATLRRKQD